MKHLRDIERKLPYPTNTLN